MAEPAVTDDIEQRIREAQEKFNAGMGADGDATPYPLLRELRQKAAVHPGWPEMGVPEDGPDGKKTFTAYSFDAVKGVFTDNIMSDILWLAALGGLFLLTLAFVQLCVKA